MKLLLVILVATGAIPLTIFADETKDIYIPSSPTSAKYIVRRLSNEELLRAPRVEPVLNEILERKGLDAPSREAALLSLADLHKTDRLTELLAAIQKLDLQTGEMAMPLGELGKLLLKSNTTDLTAQRARLQTLATRSKQAVTRQIAYATIVTADRTPDMAWKDAASDPNHLLDLVAAAPRITDVKLRELFFPKLDPILKNQAPTDLRQKTLEILPSLAGHETENFLTLARFAGEDSLRAISIRSILQIPRPFWKKESAADLSQILLGYARQVPDDQRTETDFLETTQLIQDLSSLLPPDQGKAIRQTIRELGVNVRVLKTVREQMRYDRTRLVVEAGKSVQIILQNDDAMEHNFVLTAPGAREEVGKAAETLPDPDEQGRKFVPNSPKVLQATKLVAAGERISLQFTAPAEPGEYPYLCTFPGHWSVMYGTLYVVKNIDTAVLPPENPVTEWKLADFDDKWETFETGRNFAIGKEQFSKLACIQCHQLGKEGSLFGPNLAGIVKKWKDRKTVLQQILEPSLNVEEKYRPVELKTSDDNLRGFIVAEDPQTVSVQTGPNASFIQKIVKGEIQSRSTSAISLMPSGLLNSLTQNQILDLIAYLEAEGNSEAPFFHHHPQ